MICWFDETSSLRTDVPYQLKHTTRWVAAEVEALRYQLDVDTLHRDLEATRSRSTTSAASRSAPPRRSSSTSTG